MISIELTLKTNSDIRWFQMIDAIMGLEISEEGSQELSVAERHDLNSKQSAVFGGGDPCCACSSWTLSKAGVQLTLPRTIVVPDERRFRVG